MAGHRGFLRFLALGLGLALVGAPVPARADGFGDWLMGLRREARAQGVSEATVDAALANLRPIPEVIDRERHQPELTMTHAQYLAMVITDARVQRGRALLADYGPLLHKVQSSFGVQPRFIVALWALESDYGRITGGYPVVGALATLAYSGSRRSMFRSELLDALHILDDGDVTLAGMTGSWAGAMGQCQFMPSSFRRFAVDFDGDGRRNIWTSEADVFASIANYLASLHWHPDQTWGREVRLPPGLDGKLATLKKARSLRDWKRIGVRNLDGSDLPALPLSASLVAPDGPKGSAYLVYANFGVVMKWNHSTYFATSVGLLADRIAGD
jgi:membrane-bound lytic murein transglycosylase B